MTYIEVPERHSHVPLPDYIFVGAKVQTFRGEPCTVEYIREPSRYGNSWKVTVRFEGRTYAGEYYHTVFRPMETEE